MSVAEVMRLKSEQFAARSHSMIEGGGPIAENLLDFMTRSAGFVTTVDCDEQDEE